MSIDVLFVKGMKGISAHAKEKVSYGLPFINTGIDFACSLYVRDSDASTAVKEVKRVYILLQPPAGSVPGTC